MEFTPEQLNEPANRIQLLRHKIRDSDFQLEYNQITTALDTLARLVKPRTNSAVTRMHFTSIPMAKHAIEAMIINVPEGIARDTCTELFNLLKYTVDMGTPHDAIRGLRIHELLADVIDCIPQDIAEKPLTRDIKFDILDKVMLGYQVEVAKILGISAFERLMHMPAIPLLLNLRTFMSKEFNLMRLSAYFGLIDIVLADGRACEIAAICKRYKDSVIIIAYRRAVLYDNDRIAEVFSHDSVTGSSVELLTSMINHNHVECTEVSTKATRAIIFNTALLAAIRVV